METESKIKRTVMRRIYIMNALRPLTGSAALASVAFILALVGIGHEVFVAAVFANMPSVTDIVALTRFFVAAFVNTTALVQLLSAVTLVAAFWLVRDAARAIQSSLRLV